MASGKTTFAKEFIKDKSRWIRICRDDIRRMCGNYWQPNRESLIETMEESLVRNCLNKNYSVLIDDTNLNRKTLEKWAEMAQKLKISFKTKEFIIPFKEAVKRDKNREFSVGEDTIRLFYIKYYPEHLGLELD